MFVDPDVIQSFSIFSHNTAGNVWCSRLSGSDQWGEDQPLHMPLLHIHPSSLCLPLFTYPAARANIRSQIHTLWTRHILSQPILLMFQCFILLWVRPFILLSHTPQGEIFSAGSVPVFTVSPHKAPGTLKKLAFLCIAAIICCYNPPLPAVSIFLFQGSTSSPTAVLVFVGEGRVWVRFCSLCFQKPQNKSVTWHILHH